MCGEVSLNYVEFDEFSDWHCSLNTKQTEKGETLHEAIFSLSGSALHLEKTVQFGDKWSEMEHRTQTVAQAHRIAPLNSKAGGKLEITYEWGDEDGPSVSGSASANVKDDNGNKAEITIEVESDGSGKASISAEHEEKSRSKF